MKYKRILLINPCLGMATGTNEATIYHPLGLAYIAAYLKEKDIEVKIIDANLFKIENEELIKEIKIYKPDLIGISLNIVTAINGIKLSKLIKKYFRTKVCIGGPFVSTNTKRILEKSKADFAIVGEGEEAFYKICVGEELSTINNLFWKNNKKEIIINKRGEMIKDMDSIPFPARELLPDLSLYKARARKSPVASIITSRGCPYNCNFCNHNIFGKTFRPFSVDYVLREIDLLVNKYKVKQIDVLDDNFTMDIDRAEKILDGIIERKYKILINFQCGVRADRLTPNLVNKMRKAGVFKAGIGIESGNKEILQKINKSLDLKKVEEAIKLFRKNKIISAGFFIIGFPDETQETIKETIDFALKLNPTFANFSTLIPFPGTEIYEELKQKNLLKENLEFGIDSGFLTKKMYHICPNLSEKEIQKLSKEMYSKFYFRPKKILEILLQIKSFNELKWHFEISFSILKNIFK